MRYNVNIKGKIMNKIILSIALSFGMVLFGVIPVKAAAMDAATGKYVAVESLGNVTVTTVTDPIAGTITVRKETLDPTTGITAVEIKVTNVYTGEETVTSSVIQAPRNIGYIYVGDSRLIGIDMYTGFTKDPNVWMVAQTSKGYGWLTSSAISKVDAIEKANPQITDWYEVYTLGINDMGNKDKYCAWYSERGLTHNVILLSLNPIERHRSITNESIEKFNASLIATGLNYIDCYSYLTQKGYKTADGVHFSVETNKAIRYYMQNSATLIAAKR